MLGSVANIEKIQGWLPQSRNQDCLVTNCHSLSESKGGAAEFCKGGLQFLKVHRS